MPVLSTLGAMSSRGFGQNSAAQVNYIEDVFSTYLYDGNASNQTINNGINLSGKGGMVWMKARSAAAGFNHSLFDTNRGTTKFLRSNQNDYELTASNTITAFNSNGFTFGNGFDINLSGNIYASWTFRKQPKFFDVVTYTGNGSNRTISHNLGSVPGMIFIKRLDAGADWAVYHRSLSNTEYMALNQPTGATTGTTYWNSTTPTSTVFSLGTSTDVNANGGTYVAYLFAHNAGGFGLDGSQNVITCSLFTADGAGSATVNLGWEPQFLLIKKVTGNYDWQMFDIFRGLNANSNDKTLAPNTSAAESNYGGLKINSTGFSGTGSFYANSDYIYMAIRRGPMKVPTDATTVFQPTVYTGTNVDNRLVNTTIAPDMVWIRQRDSTTVGGMVVGDRLRGQPYLLTGTTDAEVNDADSFDAQIVSTTEYGNAFSSMSGVWVGNDATSQLNASTTASNQIAEAFKRAPSFFDIVAYTGTGANQTVNHNLTVVPEFMLFKVRNTIDNPYAAFSFGASSYYYALLNSNGAASSTTYGSAIILNSAPTSSSFELKSNGAVNTNNNTYISYLFASCPGVSKVGEYTGTGTTLQINCGFSSGARFVLIKRRDDTGDWYVYDSARGIVAGNDPYILLNSTAAEVTSTDYVDTYSAGFELSSTAPAGLNANGGTYIFLAIA